MRVCENCHEPFDPHDRASATAIDGSIAQMRYCSMKCKRAVNNRRNYARTKARKKKKAKMYIANRRESEPDEMRRRQKGYQRAYYEREKEKRKAKDDL